MDAIQIESSSIWLIWIGLTALLLLLFRLLFAAELVADPLGCSSKLKAECALWCASLFLPPLVIDSPDRGLLSGCIPKLSRFVCNVRSADGPAHVLWGEELLAPPLLRASFGLRNVPEEERIGVVPAVEDVPGE